MAGEGNAFPYSGAGALRGMRFGIDAWYWVHELRSLMPRKEKARKKGENVGIVVEVDAVRWVVIRLAADLDWGRPGGRPYQCLWGGLSKPVLAVMTEDAQQGRSCNGLGLRWAGGGIVRLGVCLAGMGLVLWGLPET